MPAPYELENEKPEDTGNILDRIKRVEVILKLRLDDNVKGENRKEKFNGAVALTIDYSNGVQKSYNNISWRPEMAVCDVLQAATVTKPGLMTFQFEKTVDPGGREVGMIVAIDDIAAEQENQKWLIWVNQSFIKTELRRVTPESVTQFDLPSVELGDVIVFQFLEES
jgi:hypothetical protein